MPTPLHLKPATAAWIVRERRRLTLKPRDVAQRLGDLGLTVSEDTVKVWESNADRRPSPNLEGLERLFGSKAPERSNHAEQPGLVAAIRDQTQAISELVALLHPLVADATEGKESRLRTVEAAVALLARPDGATRRARSAPRGTTE